MRVLRSTLTVAARRCASVTFHSAAKWPYDGLSWYLAVAAIFAGCVLPCTAVLITLANYCRNYSTLRLLLNTLQGRVTALLLLALLQAAGRAPADCAAASRRALTGAAYLAQAPAQADLKPRTTSS
jgi:chromate transport protein ChrA